MEETYKIEFYKIKNKNYRVSFGFSCNKNKIPKLLESIVTHYNGISRYEGVVHKIEYVDGVVKCFLK